MATTPFPYWCLQLALPGGLQLCAALNFPEISALHGTPKAARRALEQQLAQLLADPARCPPHTLHQRAAPAAVQVERLLLQLPAPAGRPDWRLPVELPVAWVRWQQGERHNGYAPVTGIGVYGVRAELLEAALRAELLLWLGRRGPAERRSGRAEAQRGSSRAGLGELARQAALVRLEVSLESVEVELPTPRQLLRAELRGQARAAVLAEVGDLLDAVRQRPWRVDPVALARLAEALGGAAPHSVLLVGPEGCGKSTLWLELVRQRRAHGLAAYQFWQTSGARLIAGQSGYGMWQERCRELCRELAAGGKLLHLGALRELAEVGRSASGQQSIAGFLRGEIARGSIRVVAEITPEELAALERDDPALIGAFRLLELAAPSVAEQRALLDFEFEQAPGVPCALAAVQPALDWLDRLQRRYAGYSARPARALKFLRDRLAERFPQKQLDCAAITSAFARETGLPRLLLDAELPFDPDMVATWFGQRVLGQPQAVAVVVERLLQIKTALARPGRPLAALLLIGPSGTGKTELAKALAEFLFGSVSRLTRFDLSECSDPPAVQRLLGGPAAGSAEGLLTARIREQPFSVLLLDEFEKADPSLFDLLLQVLGEGRLSDGAGRVADFCNCVIVLTSNLGAAELQRGRSGFVPAAAGSTAAHFEQALQRFLRPELYNRFDAIVPFAALDPATLVQVAARQLQLLWQRPGLRYGQFELQFDPALAPWLAAQQADPRYGARPLKRVMERSVVAPLAELLNAPAATPLRRIRVQVQQDGVRLEVERGPATGTGGAGLQPLAQRLVQLRRRAARLAGCALVQQFEAEQALARQRLVRLQAKRGTASSAQSEALEARLRVLEQTLEAPRAALAAAVAAEDAALLQLWSGSSGERVAAATPEAIEAALARARRTLFRSDWAQPDRLWLALYSEHGDWLQLLLAAYTRLLHDSGGSVLQLRVLARPSAASPAPPEPTPVAQPAKWLAAPPVGVLGVQMELQGELVAALFGQEAGLHTWKPARGQGSERVALVEALASAPALPALVLRSGGIGSAAVERRRSFLHEQQLLVDNRLQPPKRYWSGSDPATEIVALARLALQLAIDAVGRTAGEG